MAVAFYVGRLGFTLIFRDADAPRYAGVRRDGVELHIQWNDPAEWTAGDRPMYRFLVSDLDALFAEYQNNGVFHERTEVRESPWGTREFAFYDPDRNGLVFYTDVRDGE